MTAPMFVHVRRGTKLTEKDWENAYTSAILQRYREAWSRKDPSLRRKMASEMAIAFLATDRACKRQAQTNETLRVISISGASASECQEAALMLESLLVVREVDVRFVDDVQEGLKLWAGKTWGWLQKRFGGPGDNFTPTEGFNVVVGRRG